MMFVHFTSVGLTFWQQNDERMNPGPVPVPCLRWLSQLRRRDSPQAALNQDAHIPKRCLPSREPLVQENLKNKAQNG